MLTLSKTVHDPVRQHRRDFIPGSHRGIDKGWTEGVAPSFRNLAAAPGKVVSVYNGGSHNGGWGCRTVIAVTDRARIAYAHFPVGGVLVRPEQIVTAGLDLGPMGSTGLATGDHQHFELYIDGDRVDPAPYLAGKALPGTPVVPTGAPASGGADGLVRKTVRNVGRGQINGRLKPTTKAAVSQTLRAGLVGHFDAFKRGEKVTQNGVTSDIWIRGAFNENWFWIGNFENRSTTGLKNLGTYKGSGGATAAAKKPVFITPPNGQFFYEEYRDALAGVNFVRPALPGGKSYDVENNPKTGPVEITIPGIGRRWVGTRRNPAKVTKR